MTRRGWTRISMIIRNIVRQLRDAPNRLRGRMMGVKHGVLPGRARKLGEASKPAPSPTWLGPVFSGRQRRPIGCLIATGWVAFSTPRPCGAIDGP